MIEAVIRHKRQAEHHLFMTLFIPPELDYFRGHFPNRPVLPGVVQTHWAILYGCQYLNLPDRIKRLEVIKFKHLIRPEMEIDLSLELKANGKLNYRYMLADDVMSSGRIVYPDPATA